jgi:hypothetical protein
MAIVFNATFNSISVSLYSQIERLSVRMLQQDSLAISLYSQIERLSVRMLE